MLKRIVDVFLFSGFYISICAVLMSGQTFQLLNLSYQPAYYWFVFFSTVASYNFHWYLTPAHTLPSRNLGRINDLKTLHLLLTLGGLLGSIVFFFALWSHAHWILIGAFFTFLYSAPKLPIQASAFLRRIAIGKTIYLSFVWTYVTTVMPLLMAGKPWTEKDLLFTGSRFFLIYAICVLFDYRDREQDRKEGIRSMITWFNEKGINTIFYLSMFLFLICLYLLYVNTFSLLISGILVLPGLLLLFLYPSAKKNASDYFYLFVLDGLMMLSSLITYLIL